MKHISIVETNRWFYKDIIAGNNAHNKYSGLTALHNLLKFKASPVGLEYASLRKY